MIRLGRSLTVIALLAVLAGCVEMANDGFETKLGKVKTPALLANLEIASLVGTKKTMFDHVATWVTGRDCSSPRAERNGAYCVDWPAHPAPPPQEYCYATLGRPTCYAQPYSQDRGSLIGFVAASTPVR